MKPARGGEAVRLAGRRLSTLGKLILSLHCHEFTFIFSFGLAQDLCQIHFHTSHELVDLRFPLKPLCVGLCIAFLCVF